MAKKFTPKDTVFLGLGLAALTRDKMMDALDYLLREGKVAAKDQRELLEQLKKRGKKEYGIMNREIQHSLKAMLKKPKAKKRRKAKRTKRRKK